MTVSPIAVNILLLAGVLWLIPRFFRFERDASGRLWILPRE